jgi:hypothetical protein
MCEGTACTHHLNPAVQELEELLLAPTWGSGSYQPQPFYNLKPGYWPCISSAGARWPQPMSGYEV